MTGVLKKALKLIVGDNPVVLPELRIPKGRPLKKLTERELIQLESEIGAKLFGEVSPGHRREFFCLDATTWIWYEQWKDPGTGKPQQFTTRYEVHEKGILKVLEGAKYSYITGDELSNFVTAVTLYYEQVARHVYKRDPKTGEKLA